MVLYAKENKNWILFFTLVTETLAYELYYLEMEDKISNDIIDCLKDRVSYSKFVLCYCPSRIVLVSVPMLFWTLSSSW